MARNAGGTARASFCPDERSYPMQRADFPAMPKPFPSMFGRFASIVRERERLAPTLGLVREMAGALLGGYRQALKPELRPAPLMAALYSELSKHFTAEEGPAYFGTVASDSPELKRRVDALCSEHTAMLETAAELVELARDAVQSEKLALRVLGLLDQLSRHEQSETELLRGFFGSGSVQAHHG
jgi:hypothetical protein